MPAITPEDWGRIYAYIWRETRRGTQDLKQLFEKDPASAVKEITAKLGIDYHDRLFDIDDPPGEFGDKELEGIINETNTNFQFFLRLTC